ncbi:MAG: hypothetical protein KDC92_18015, partial [Bacteroidetes bacterium]|nr:hypothetical protein [Bacteroidota bacterium]
MTNALERIYFFLVVFGVYSVGAFGQSKSKEWIDSMETYINQNEPRDSIGLLEKMDLAFNLLKYDRPKAMRMLAEANRSANELQLPYVEAMIYLRRATVMRLTRNLDSAQYYLLKAKPIFNKRKRPVDIKGWYSEMAGFHMGKGQLDSALVYFQKSTQITRKMGDSSALVKALGNKALIYMHMKKLQLATAYIDSAIVLNEQIGAKSDLVGLYNIQSRIFEERGMRKHSMDIGLKILELSKELGLQNNLAMQYYNVGLAYNKLKDYNKSIIFYKKGWPYLKKFPRADLELAYLFQTGYAYNEINQVDSAKFYLQLTEDMAKEQKDYSRYCRALHTRGLIYYQEGNLTEYLQNMVTVAEYMPKLKGDVLYEAQREFGKVFYRTL